MVLSLRPFCSGVIRHCPRLTPMSTRGSDTQEKGKHYDCILIRLEASKFYAL